MTKESGHNSQEKQLTSQVGPSNTSSIVIIGVVCCLYVVLQSSLTITSKTIFTKFESVSPLSLLMVQCTINVFICLLLMLYKEIDSSAYHCCVKYGITIPSLSEMSNKARLGLKVGALNLPTAIFALYSIKLVNIPL